MTRSILVFLTVFAAISLSAAQTDLVKLPPAPRHGLHLDDPYDQLRFLKTTDYGATWSGIQQAGDLSTFAPIEGTLGDFSAVTTADNQLCYAVYLETAATPGIYSFTGPNFAPVLVMAEGTNDLHDIGGVYAEGWTDIGKTPNGDLFVLIWGWDSLGANTFWCAKSTNSGVSWGTPFVAATSPDLDETCAYPHLSQMNSATNVFLIFQKAVANGWDQYVGRIPVDGGTATLTRVGISGEEQRNYYTGACQPIAYDPQHTGGALYFAVWDSAAVGCTVYGSNDQGQTFTSYNLATPVRYPCMAVNPAAGIPFVFSNVGPTSGQRHHAWFSYDELGYFGGSWAVPPETLAVCDTVYDGTRPLFYMNQGCFWDANRGVAMIPQWGAFTPEGLYTERTTDGGTTWTGLSRRWQYEADSMSGGFCTNQELVGGTNGVAYVAFSGISLRTNQYATVSGTVTLAEGAGDVTYTTVSADGVGAPSTHPSADGHYVLNNVQTGQRQITASLMDYRSVTLQENVPVAGLDSVDFSMQLRAISGNVSGIWRRADSPIICSGNIALRSRDTLIIEAGVEVRLPEAGIFTVGGLLRALGTAQDSIRFTRDTLVSHWGTIVLDNVPDSTRLDYCVFEHGGEEDGFGAVEVLDCAPHFSHCAWRLNTSAYGGALTCGEAGIPRFSYCQFVSDSGAVAGVCNAEYLASPQFDHCLFARSGGIHSGAIYFNDAQNVHFESCIFEDNSGGQAGAIESDSSTVTFSNCQFIRNASLGSGSTLISAGHGVTMTNCVVYGSNSLANNPAIACINSSPVISNSIVISSNGAAIGFGLGSDTARVRSCDFALNSGGNFQATGGTIPAGLGVLSTTNANGDSCDQFHNIFSNPLFADTAAHLFHLTDFSRCIGAGDTSGIASTDYDGHPRPNPAGSHPDIGAFENVYGTPALSARDHAAVPRVFDLSVYPNPFNPQAVIRFVLPNSGKVALKVFDLNGRFVKTLSDQILQAGEHSILFDGADLPSGVYFVRMETATVSQTRKMVLLK